MENQSKYDPSRKTVGAIYRDAVTSSNGYAPEVGEMVNEILKGYLEDLVTTAQSNPFEGRPFYITVHEKKDLQMKQALLRRMLVSIYRPWPEDDLDVYWTDPKTNEIRHCWSLPHHSEMPNIMMNFTFYDPQLVEWVSAWKAFRMENFGFMKNAEGNWIANPNFKDIPLGSHASKLLISL